MTHFYPLSMLKDLPENYLDSLKLPPESLVQTFLPAEIS